MTKDFNQDDLEALWSGLLSRDTTTVRLVFNSLSKREQDAIVKHLERMSTEPGWHPAQRASAKAALKILHRPRQNHN